jgi:ParB/RepB/Spo0J family partition protein
MTDDYRNVLYSLIDAPEDAHRTAIDPERIGALADDIAANGLLQPPGIRGPSETGRYAIVWGHRRWLAVGLLRWPEMPCKLFPWTYDPLVARTAENFMQEKLTPVEEAEIVRRFVQRGMPASQVARHCRRSLAWVGARVRLLEWPQDVQDGVQDGRLSLGVAELLAQIEHQEYRVSLIGEATRSGASIESVGVWLAHWAAEKGRLIANHETIADIAARREVWRIVTPCDYCGQDQAYELTRSFRLCSGCTEELEAAIRGARSMPATP